MAGLDEIRQWVLSLGPEAEVVAPAELKLAVRPSLKAALVQYSGFSGHEVGAKMVESRQHYFS